MKDLLKLAAECMAQLNALGIDCGKVTFTVNTRAKKRWGQCRVVGAGSYEISISERLLHDDVDDMAAKNTIMHELAHAADRVQERSPWRVGQDSFGNNESISRIQYQTLHVLG